MKSCVVLLLMFFAFSMIIDTCIAEKVCPERAIPVETPEGTLCVCSQGYFGDNCRFKVLPLEKNMKNSNQTDEDKCNHWYDCLSEQWFRFIERIKGLEKQPFKYGLVIGTVIGIFSTIILRAICYAVVRLYQYCHKKKRSSVCLDKCSPSSRVDSVVIDIESECEKKDDNGSQPIEMKQSMINIAEDVLPEAARACGSVSLL